MGALCSKVSERNSIGYCKAASILPPDVTETDSFTSVSSSDLPLNATANYNANTITRNQPPSAVSSMPSIPQRTYDPEDYANFHAFQCNGIDRSLPMSIPKKSRSNEAVRRYLYAPPQLCRLTITDTNICQLQKCPCNNTLHKSIEQPMLATETTTVVQIETPKQVLEKRIVFIDGLTNVVDQLKVDANFDLDLHYIEKSHRLMCKTFELPMSAFYEMILDSDVNSFLRKLQRKYYRLITNHSSAEQGDYEDALDEENDKTSLDDIILSETTPPPLHISEATDEKTLWRTAEKDPWKQSTEIPPVSDKYHNLSTSLSSNDSSNSFAIDNNKSARNANLNATESKYRNRSYLLSEKEENELNELLEQLKSIIAEQEASSSAGREPKITPKTVKRANRGANRLDDLRRKYVERSETVLKLKSENCPLNERSFFQWKFERPLYIYRSNLSSCLYNLFYHLNGHHIEPLEFQRKWLQEIENDVTWCRMLKKALCDRWNQTCNTANLLQIQLVWIVAGDDETVDKFCENMEMPFYLRTKNIANFIRNQSYMFERIAVLFRIGCVIRLCNGKVNISPDEILQHLNSITSPNLTTS